MKIVVVDDERPARSELIFLLSSLLPDAEFLEAGSAEAAKELLLKNRVCACFLDINLGEVRGTALASMVRKQQPDAAVVFVTAYQNYAAEAFELDAVDYIMKPYDLKRLEKTVEKLRHQGYLTDCAGKDCISEEALEKVAVNAGDRIRLLEPEKIILLEAIRHGSRVYTKDQRYEEGTTLGMWEERLLGKGFFRLHKSYLVNLSYVEEFVPSYNNGYSVRLKSLPELEIPVSRLKYRELREIYHF